MHLVAIGFAYCGGIDDRRLQRDVAKMTRQERSILESIDTVLRSENVREQIRPIVERVRAELGRKKEALMTWEPIPLSVFGHGLPSEIRSAWVFVLRAGADTDIQTVINA
jgi:hypothetical protein